MFGQYPKGRRCQLATIKPRCGNCQNKVSLHICIYTKDDKPVKVIANDPCHFDPSRFASQHTKDEVSQVTEKIPLNHNDDDCNNRNKKQKKRAATKRISRRPNGIH